MGNDATKEGEMRIKVGTLNYSGILLSPYQFFEKEDSQETQLSDKMEKIYKAFKDKKKDHEADKQKDKGNQKEQQWDKKIDYPFKDGGKDEDFFGPLDKQWQKNRFSPFYVPTCGIKNNVSLLSKQQFFDEWDAKARQNDKNINKWIKDEKKMKTDTYLQNLRQFDYLVYRSLLQTLYKFPQQISQLAKINQNSFQLDSKKYRQSRKTMFRKPFLNEELKINKTVQMIQKLKLDILFVQEANMKLVKAIEKDKRNLRIVRSIGTHRKEMPSESIIIINQDKIKFEKFKNLLEQNKMLTGNTVWLENSSIEQVRLTEDDFKRLNFNEDTVIQCLYNLILISTHLSSKESKNFDQIQQLQQRIFFLKTKFPQCHIILGGDLNTEKVARLFNGERSQIQAEKNKMQSKEPRQYNPSVLEKEQRDQFNKIFNIMPKVQKTGSNPKLFTVNKKRTFAQCQPKKGNELKRVVIDYFISDLDIEDVKITTIDQKPLDFTKPQQLQLLPSTNHPYDHYLLTGTIVLKQKLKHVTDLQYKFKYTPSLLTKKQLGQVDTNFIQKINTEMAKYQWTQKFLKILAARQEKYPAWKLEQKKKQEEEKKKGDENKKKGEENKKKGDDNKKGEN